MGEGKNLGVVCLQAFRLPFLDPAMTRAVTAPAPTACSGASGRTSAPAQDLETQRTALLREVAARYGFDPVPNESADVALAPDPAPSAFSHLRLSGTVLSDEFRAAARLGEALWSGGVPVLLAPGPRYAPLATCIICGGNKGETYQICAGCYTINLRYAESRMLAVLPDAPESVLAGLRPFTQDEWNRGVRGTPRTEPVRRGSLAPGAERAYRVMRRAVVAADRDARIAAQQRRLAKAVAAPILPPLPRRGPSRDAFGQALSPDRFGRRRLAAAHRRHAHHVAAERAVLEALQNAEAWDAGAFIRDREAVSTEAYWLELLTAQESAGEAAEDDDDYPVTWQDAEWMQAPDRVDSYAEALAGEYRGNAAADTDIHREAIHVHALLEGYRVALRRAMWANDPDRQAQHAGYARFLARQLLAFGVTPNPVRSRGIQEIDEQEEARWDRWIDAIVAGERAPAPELSEYHLALCGIWAEAQRWDHNGDPVAPERLPRLDSGLPSGKLRWPHFIREELEAEYGPFAGLLADLGDGARAWYMGEGDEMQPQGEEMTESQWQAHVAWEGVLRETERASRFEQLAIHMAGIHPTRIEHGRATRI